MTPEEKAVEITKKMGYAAGTYINDLVLDIAKRSAIICCDEIIAELEPDDLFQNYNERVTYWKDVKEEIKKI